MAQESFTLVLAKEDFKFSCAHFTLFGPHRAELLHGHNYQVALELTGHELDADDLLIDFPSVKKSIRGSCARLDSLTLIPTESPHLRIEEGEKSVTVTFRDRSYQLPKADVLLLPLVNTSIEALARMLWQELVAQVALPRVEKLGVHVSETAGQGCWYRASFESP
jgi:6-pyruvoyltetrahydropterin/6-carboxytetrahydropterin synthase